MKINPSEIEGSGLYSYSFSWCQSSVDSIQIQNDKTRDRLVEADVPKNFATFTVQRSHINNKENVLQAYLTSLVSKNFSKKFIKILNLKRS